MTDIVDEATDVMTPIGTEEETPRFYNDIKIVDPITIDGIDGHIATLVRLDALPDGFDLDNGWEVRILIEPFATGNVIIPSTGFICLTEIFLVQYGPDKIIFNLHTKGVESMLSWGTGPHINFTQVIMNRNDTLAKYVPGSLFLITAEIGKSPEKPAKKTKSPRKKKPKD